MVKIGDAVRLKACSPLRELLEPWVDAVGRVTDAVQVDDDELRIYVAFADPLEGYTSPLSADEFELDGGRPGEPF